MPVRMRPHQKVLLVVFLLAAVGIWVPGGDVARLVADQEHVLLGRYSVDHFSLLFFMTPILLFAAWLQVRRPSTDRTRAFKVAALIFAVLLGLAFVEVAGRLAADPRYQQKYVVASDALEGEDRTAALPVRHRPPNVRYRVHYHDVPPTKRSYPVTPPGFATEEIVLTSDANGFRNQRVPDTCEILAVGDSFAEGSRVGDDECWPALVAAATGWSVYNLGMSGSSPAQYRANFEHVGRALKPKVVLLMLYEGNDLRGGDEEGEEAPARDLGRQVGREIKNSPIVRAVKATFIGVFGGLNAGGSFAGQETVDWMPLAIPAMDGLTHHVAFKPKRMLYLDKTEDEVRAMEDWITAQEAIRAVHAACRQDGARLIVVYAPSTPHVVLPIVRDHLDVARLHAFASLEEDDLPPPEAFFKRFFERLGNTERVVQSFCADEGIEFLSTTEALREATRRGRQVYYTYDQHWTRLGHEVVGNLVSRHLAE